MKKESILLSDLFKEFIKVSAKGRRLMQSGKRVTQGVLNNYTYALMLLEEFEEKDIQPVRILITNQTSLHVLKKERQYWLKFFTGFSAFLFQQKGCYDNYVAATFKIIKSVFNYAKNYKGLPIGEYHRLFQIPAQQLSPIVLLPEQLHFLIYNEIFDQQLPDRLKGTRDIMIFGCTTGLRISDLMSLRRKHLSYLGGESYLTIYTQKTNTPVKIPLPAYCLNIIARHSKKNRDFLLPRLSKTNINIQIKEIGKRAGWNWILPKYQSKQGRLVEQKYKGQSWRFYQHLTAHTMRRTAITTLLMLGVDEAVVRKISGHSPGSKEFYRYITLAQSYVDQQVKTAFIKFSKDPVFYKTRDFSK